MKPHLFLTVLILAAHALPLLAQTTPQILWGDSVNNFSLGLALSNSTYDLEKPILVTVHLRNDAKEDNSMMFASPRCLFSFIATDNSRNPVKPQEIGSHCDGSLASGPLPPGQMKATVMDLREFLYLTNGGKYVITAKRLLGWPTFVMSGNAVIEVLTPARPSPLAGTGEAIAKSDAKSLVAPQPENRGNNPSNGRSPENNPNIQSPSAAQPVSSPSILADVSPATPLPRFNSTQRIGVGITAALLALLVVVLGRAARRNRHR